MRLRLPGAGPNQPTDPEQQAASRRPRSARTQTRGPRGKQMIARLIARGRFAAVILVRGQYVNCL
jgi:hypothetical protein